MIVAIMVPPYYLFYHILLHITEMLFLMDDFASMKRLILLDVLCLNTN